MFFEYVFQKKNHTHHIITKKEKCPPLHVVPVGVDFIVCVACACQWLERGDDERRLLGDGRIRGRNCSHIVVVDGVLVLHAHSRGIGTI